MFIIIATSGYVDPAGNKYRALKTAKANGYKEG